MEAIEKRTMAKVTRRLVPFLMLCYFIAYLDRVNVGFAGATMSRDLALSSAAFGGAARHLLHRLFLLRGAEQSRPRSLRRAQMDRPHHSELGRHLGRPGFRCRRARLHR